MVGTIHAYKENYKLFILIFYLIYAVKYFLIKLINMITMRKNLGGPANLKKRRGEALWETG